jgi:hypothetical protein
LVGGLTLDVRLQIFVFIKFSDICITKVNKMYLEIVRSREPRTTVHAVQEPITFCISIVCRGMNCHAEIPESVLG